MLAGQGYTLLTNQAYATGSDLYNFYCAGGQCLTAYDCATYCKNTVECTAFTYVNGLCNLKSAATNLVATNGAYAGFITHTNVVAPPYVGAFYRYPLLLTLSLSKLRTSDLHKMTCAETPFFVKRKVVAWSIRVGESSAAQFHSRILIRTSSYAMKIFCHKLHRCRY